MPTSTPLCEYRVARFVVPPKIDAAWDKAPWSGVESASLDCFMGDKPEHAPRVRVRVGYDPLAVYVIFHVQDRWVRAVTDALHGPVCTDSCVEFFFTPGEDVGAGYFNLEMNCGGVMLLHYQKIPRRDHRPLAAELCAKIGIAHSLPRRVEPEMAEPVTWSVEYRLPLAILSGFMPVAQPGPGVVWRANFFKCADDTSHPHWLTWNKVERPRPDFHVPEYFGRLVFE